MKKLKYILLLVSLTSSSFGQLQNVWSKEFTFGLENGQPFGLFVGDSNIVASGYTIDNSGGVMAAIINFSTEGDTLWSRIGNNWSQSVYASATRVGDYLFWDQGTHHENDILVKKDLSGNTIWSNGLPYKGAFIIGWGNSLILISGSTIAILDTSGNIEKSNVYSNASIGGMMTLRIKGNELTLIGIGIANPFYGMVMKIDLLTLKSVWETHIQGIARCFGDIDAEGNVYFVGSRVVEDTTAPGFLEFWYSKIDGGDGHIIAEKGWYARNTYETNYENWIDGVAFHNGIVAMGGSIQKGDTHSGKSFAYMATLNASDGRKTWDTTIDFGGFTINQIENMVFDSSGDLIVLRNAALPYLNWLEKYRLTVTAIDVPRGTLPQNFELFQNYPNPFNPSTVIRYQVVGTTHVRLAIYDVLGREVATLVNEEKTAGTYEAIFNASNLSSGVYFYRLEADGFIETKKMVLLK